MVTFDADPTASVNTRSVALWQGVRMENCAISRNDGSAILHVAASLTLSSMQQPITPEGALNHPLGRCDYLVRDGLEIDVDIEVPTRSIDSLCAEGLPAPIWLTIDTQGHEMEILSGARRALNDSVAGLTIEVSFVDLYDSTPGVGDIHNFMTEHGFDLVDVKPIHAHRSREPFAWRGRSSILMADLTYIRTMDRPDWSPTRRFSHSFVALVVGCTDIALRILQNLNQCPDPDPDLGRITDLLRALSDLTLQLSPCMPNDWLNVTLKLSRGTSDWKTRESNDYLMVQSSRKLEEFLHAWDLPAAARAVKEYREGFLDHVPAELWGAGDTEDH
jgi:FkbM family methyltransferase